jgi:hypothetical protein
MGLPFFIGVARGEEEAETLEEGVPSAVEGVLIRRGVADGCY